MMGGYIYVSVLVMTIPVALLSPTPLDHLTMNLNLNDSPKGDYVDQNPNGGYRDRLFDQQSQLLGCYEDHVPFLHGMWNIFDTNTPEQCIGSCATRGYSYAGVKDEYCQCGNDEPPASLTRDWSECDTKCPGDSSLFCGGNWRQNVFTTKKTTGLHSFTASVKGCVYGFTGRNVDDVSLQECKRLCLAESNFVCNALEYIHKNHEGKQFCSLSKETRESQPGAWEEPCRGDWADMVYMERIGAFRSNNKYDYEEDVAGISDIPLSVFLPQICSASDSQYYPDSSDCTKFYQCAAGHPPARKTCAPGTKWSQQLLTCDTIVDTTCPNKGNEFGRFGKLDAGDCPPQCIYDGICCIQCCAQFP